jgi:hypothetical protein
MPLPKPTRLPKREEEAPAPRKVPEKKVEKEDFRPSDVFRFDPKEDITAYEIAYLVSQFWTLDVAYDRFFQFTEELQKQFRPIKG